MSHEWSDKFFSHFYDTQRKLVGLSHEFSSRFHPIVKSWHLTLFFTFDFYVFLYSFCVFFNIFYFLCVCSRFFMLIFYIDFTKKCKSKISLSLFRVTGFFRIFTVLRRSHFFSCDKLVYNKKKNRDNCY